MSLTSLRRELKRASNPTRAAFVAGFFKTKKGEYGYGDVFNGADAPSCRRIAKQYRNLSLVDVATLLKSRIHEERFTALIILTLQFAAGDEKTRDDIYRFYLKNTTHINNWDLVDVSAYHIVGTYLLNKPRAVLDRLARNKHLWTRRIAIVSTLAFIRRGETADTFRIAKILLPDTHDLIHKAVGWMLREAGKKDTTGLRQFLTTHTPRMPRTMLRYAIERMDAPERKKWMNV